MGGKRVTLPLVGVIAATLLGFGIFHFFRSSLPVLPTVSNEISSAGKPMPTAVQPGGTVSLGQGDIKNRRKPKPSGAPIVVADQVSLLENQIAASDPKAVSNMVWILHNVPNVFDADRGALGNVTSVQLDSLTQLAKRELLAKPENSTSVSDCQYVIASSLLLEGKDKDALVEARRSFDVGSLKSTKQSIALLLAAFSRVDKSSGSSLKNRFVEEQRTGSLLAIDNSAASSACFVISKEVNSGGAASALKSIETGESDFKGAADDPVLAGQTDYNSLMARGNLLLLDGRPVDARQCFLRAGQSPPKMKGKQLLAPIEGIARSLKAESGAIGAANAILHSLSIGQADPAFFQHDAFDLKELVAAGKRIEPAELPPEVRDSAAAVDIEANTETNEEIKVTWDCECAPQTTAVTQLGNAHFQLSLLSDMDRKWFLLHVHGAAGKTVWIDLKDSAALVKSLGYSKPMYSYANDLDSLDSYQTCESLSDGPTTSPIPSATPPNWRYIHKVWHSAPDVFSFAQLFEKDDAFVAIRVPYSPGYNERYLNKIVASNPHAEVVEVGRSTEKRPLLLVKICDDEKSPTKPCVLIYAGEQADHPDGMWVAKHILDCLLEDSAEATHLRGQINFLVLPMLDPDATASGVHQHLVGRFNSRQKAPENISYANWFDTWVDAGHRLDLILNISGGPAEGSPNLFCWIMEGNGVRGKLSNSLHQRILAAMQKSGYLTRPEPDFLGWSLDRLGGWMSRNYGPVTLHYEFGGNARECPLNYLQLKEPARILLNSVGEFLASEDAKLLLGNVDEVRNYRLQQLSRYKPIDPTEDAIDKAKNRMQIKLEGLPSNSVAERFVP